MALTDEGTGFNVSMPVAPAYGGGYGNNGGFGGFGGDWGWIILLLLCANGGWGGFGGFGGMGGFGGAMWDFPWLINGQQGINNNVSDGFRSAQLSDGITSIRDGISGLSTQLCGCCGDIQNSLCNGFSGVTAAVTGAQNAISQQMYSNEIASLNRSFAEQTANMQGFNSVNSGIADLRYTEATEACATRTAAASNTRDILTALTAGVQSIKDQLCQDKIDAKNDEIAQLRQEVLYTRGQAAAESIYQRGQNSQDVQTAQILAGQAAIPGQVYTRLSECPVSTVPVYGRQPIFQCNNGCGCGCGNNF